MSSAPYWARNMICQSCMTPQEGRPPFKRCSGCKAAYYCDAKCQKDNWVEHKPYCKDAQILPDHPTLGPVLERYPQLDRDTRHYLVVVGPRIAEAIILALDIPRRPNSRNEEIMMVVVSYDPDGPRDIQRFTPIFCGMHAMENVRSRDSWRRVLDEHDRYDARVRTLDRGFGAALVQFVVLPPPASGSSSAPTASRESLMTSFMTVRIAMQHSSIPGNGDYAAHILRWMYYLKLTGDLRPMYIIAVGLYYQSAYVTPETLGEITSPLPLPALEYGRLKITLTEPVANAATQLLVRISDGMQV